MKKFLSLLLVAVMVFGVIGLVGCKGGQNETTTTTTTQGAQTTTTTTKETTTTVGTTTTTTTTTATTPKETTTETTTTTTTTPKETTTETTTTTTTTTEPISTTTLPMFTRFDFGKDTVAQDNGGTSHQWLVDNLTYNKEYIYIEFLEDSWKIWAKKSYEKGTTAAGVYSINFDNLLTIDYEDLVAGWGTWTRYPAQSKYVGTSWEGKHQYMKIRIKNNTVNNMIGFQFKCNGGYALTTYASNMYLQDGVDKLTAADVKNEWAVYYFDVPMCSQASSNGYGAGRDAVKCKSYSEWLDRNATTGGNNGQNWTNPGTANVAGIRFHLLGAEYGYYNPATGNYAKYKGVAEWCDSRINIKKGTWVEVDYIIFGSTPQQLETYKSKMELAGN